MRLIYENTPLYVHDFHYRLGSTRYSLEELKAQKLIAGSVDTLSAMGYGHCFGLGENETLVTLAAGPVQSVLKRTTEPGALVFQHCHAESAVLPVQPDDSTGESRNRYFAAEVMKELNVDHLPYFCSFASGCAGFLSLLVTAGGLLSNSQNQSAICAMADCRPPAIPFDLLRERILGSDHGSAFVVSGAERGYQLMGVNYYSTTRKLVPLVEIVKRTVEMIQTLATDLKVDLRASDVTVHYPNIFPETWSMVTRYLRVPKVEHVLDEMFERAHCGATDSVISLRKRHQGDADRVHIVVNYGVGLHLGVCMLKEMPNCEGERNSSSELETSNPAER